MPSGTVITITYGYFNTGGWDFYLHINGSEVDTVDADYAPKDYVYTVTSDISIEVVDV